MADSVLGTAETLLGELVLGETAFEGAVTDEPVWWDPALTDRQLLELILKRLGPHKFTTSRDYWTLTEGIEAAIGFQD